MKKFIIFITYSCLLTLCSAEANTLIKKGVTPLTKKIIAKCHVSLITGNEAIIPWRVELNKINSLYQNIVGKKVWTQESSEKIEIYKVFQCVAKEDYFTSNKAKLLDLNTD